jgi:uncharacterized coiled-coil protein SlyX
MWKLYFRYLRIRGMGFINIYLNSEEVTLKLNIIMSKIEELSQKVDELQVVVDSKQEQVALAISALEATIASLNALLSEGATPEQLQAVIEKVEVVKADVESTPLSE